jgi:peptidoglycan/xylan/chitin deacetylase (PgdA/CDA1 family)
MAVLFASYWHPMTPTPPPQLRIGKRQRLAEAADSLGLLAPLRLLHDRGRSTLTVLAYHRVVPVESFDSYALDLDLISCSPDEFDAQMGFLRENMNPVSLAQVADHLDGRIALPPRAVAVTFDDGFRDTYHHAFRALRTYEIPATVFITTGYVDSGEPFWFELAAHLMMRVAPRAIHVPECPTALPLGPSVPERRESIRVIHTVLKALPDARRHTLMGQLTREFANCIDASAVDLSRPMTWDEVREMSAAGVDFGSHTVTHPNLAKLGDADLSHELTESRHVMERQLGKQVLSVAYPFGTPSAYSERVLAAAGSAGYRIGMSYVPGVNWKGSMPRYELRRKGVSFWMSPAYFRALLSLPEWIH